MDTFELFNNGKLILPEKEVDFAERGCICLPSLCLPYVELNKRLVCTGRRYGNRNYHHMRRSAVSAGRLGSLITDTEKKNDAKMMQK